jgi:hypothetical protein
MECLIDAVQYEDVAYNSAPLFPVQPFLQRRPASHAET